MTRRQAIGIIALFAVALLITFVRWMIDRDPIDGLGFAWPDEAYAHVSAKLDPHRGGDRWCARRQRRTASGITPQSARLAVHPRPIQRRGLGVMVAMYVGYVTGYEAMRTGTNAAPALVGAMAVLAVVYSLGRRRGLLDPLSLVLVGVIASAMCGALIMFLQRLVPGGLRGELAVWMMGHIPQDLERLQLVLLCGLASLAWRSRRCLAGDGRCHARR
jgi:hypothetical protein